MQNSSVHCQQAFENKKFVGITQQCFALLPQVNLPTNNLNFHWRWRWWDWIQAIFLNFFYFNWWQNMLMWQRITCNTYLAIYLRNWNFGILFGMLTLYAKQFDNFNDIFHSFRQNVARQFMQLSGSQLQRNASEIKFDKFVQK